MDLRDRFAAQFAAALVDAFADPGQIARRAYDLAEAMLEERARRIDAEEETAIAEAGAAMDLEPESVDFPGPQLFDEEGAMYTLEAPPPYPHAALLDDPAPMSEAEPADDDELPGWLEPPYDPRWELEARWATSPGDAPARRISSRPPGPGLARTQPESVTEERPARSGRAG
jgi:hypothetical protein